MPFLITQLIERNFLTPDMAVGIEEELKNNPNKTEEEVLISKGLIAEDDLFKDQGRDIGYSFRFDAARRDVVGSVEDRPGRNRQVLPDDPVK